MCQALFRAWDMSMSKIKIYSFLGKHIMDYRETHKWVTVFQKVINILDKKRAEWIESARLVMA